MSSAIDLTTTALAKSWLKLPVSYTADDTLFDALVTSVSDFIQSTLNRVFGTATYVEVRNGKGTPAMMFQDYPVSGVTSLTIDGVTIDEAADLDTPGYLFSDKMIYLQGYTFTRGFQNVQIVYTAGYTTIPEGIQQLALDLIAKKYKQRDRIGLKSQVLENQTITYDLQDLNDEVRSVLKQYAKVVPIS